MDDEKPIVCDEETTKVHTSRLNCHRHCEDYNTYRAHSWSPFHHFAQKANCDMSQKANHRKTRQNDAPPPGARTPDPSMSCIRSLRSAYISWSFYLVSLLDFFLAYHITLADFNRLIHRDFLSTTYAGFSHCTKPARVYDGSPLSSKYGTYTTVKARFWPWLSGKSH